MKAYTITDDIHTVTGLRLAGVDGVFVDGTELTFEDAFERALADTTLGILLIEPRLIEQHKEAVDAARLERTQPLIVPLIDLNDDGSGPSLSEQLQHDTGITL